MFHFRECSTFGSLPYAVEDPKIILIRYTATHCAYCIGLPNKSRPKTCNLPHGTINCSNLNLYSHHNFLMATKLTTNTNTNIIYIARLTNCPGALTNIKTRDGIDEFLKDLKNHDLPLNFGYFLEFSFLFGRKLIPNDNVHVGPKRGNALISTGNCTM